MPRTFYDSQLNGPSSHFRGSFDLLSDAFLTFLFSGFNRLDVEMKIEIYKCVLKSCAKLGETKGS